MSLIDAEGIIILPHLMGRRTPRANPIAKGATYGLTPKHTRHHLYRALLEGIAFGFREEFKGVRSNVKKVVIAGGGANSSLWRQIISDVLNVELEYSVNGSASMGAAYLTGYALGLFKDFTEIKRNWLSLKDSIVPNIENAQLYDKLFAQYVEFDKILDGINSC
ncbi:MAG: FGGY-family carbohydrate kinase [Bacillota bacterium]